jgi:hypothetical protein
VGQGIGILNRYEENLRRAEALCELIASVFNGLPEMESPLVLRERTTGKRRATLGQSAIARS